MNRKVLIIDCGNLMYRTLHGCIHQCPEDQENFYLWRHAFITSLFENIRRFKPDHVVVAQDSKINWRYNIYPEYKANRKLRRAKSDINFENFFPISNKFFKDIKNIFSNIVFLKVDDCEADDIIATLCYKSTGEEITILSSDTDLLQLQIGFPKIKQYDPMKNEYIQSINPKKDLFIKIIAGDRGDFIYGIKPRCGIKTAEKIIEKNLLEEELKNEEVRKIYERNVKLIDLKNIPKEISENVWNIYSSYQKPQLNLTTKVLDFWYQNKLVDLMERWGEDYKPFIKELT